MTNAPAVLLLCDRLDLAGGVERFVCTLANQLAQRGFDVAVGSVATAHAQMHYTLRPEVHVLHGMQPLAAGGGRVALLKKQWQIGRTLGALAQSQPQRVLLLNGLTTACSVLALNPGLAARSVCCDHNHFFARSRPWQWLRRRLYRHVAAVVSLTQADAARFAAINPRTQVIANASTLQATDLAPAADTQGNEVLAVGRHVAQKGLDLLLEAWAQVQRVLPTARLRIVGDGPLQPALQAQASALGLGSSVVWQQPTSNIAALYRQAALFVLPSRYEGMPLALLEAQALGLPAVAFDCPTGPAEIVTSDTGIVVPAGDTAALAQALLQLLNDAPRRAAMGVAARLRAQTHFSPSLHFERWAALLRDVAARTMEARA